VCFWRYGNFKIRSYKNNNNNKSDERVLGKEGLTKGPPMRELPTSSVVVVVVCLLACLIDCFLSFFLWQIQMKGLMREFKLNRLELQIPVS
jgi:hypothetical protein